MNEDILKSKWKELKGGVKGKWGDLTDDDVTEVEGKTEKLVGILQEKYGYSKDKAQENITNSWKITSSTPKVKI